MPSETYVPVIPPRTADIHQPTPHPSWVYRKELYMSIYCQLLEKKALPRARMENPGEVITAEVVAMTKTSLL